MLEKAKNIYDKNKYAILGAFLFAFVVHFYIISNYIPNHDDLAGIVIDMDLSTSGRWFSRFATRMSSVYTMHAVNGLICTGLVSLAAVTLTEILEIKEKLNKAIIIALFVVFPTVAGSLSYMQTADGYGIAIFLAVMGCYLLKQHTWTGYISALVCFTLSCGIFQAYITVAMGILYILIVKKFFDNKKIERDFRKEIFCYVSSIVVSLLAYLGILKIALRITGEVLSSYSNIDSMGKFTISEIMMNFVDVYKNFYHFFSGNGGTYSWIVVIANIVIIGLIVMIFARMYTKLNGINRLYLLLLFLVVPIAFNSIELLKPAGNDCSILTTYAFVLIYIFAVTLLDTRKNVEECSVGQKWVKYICVLCMLIIIWNNYLLTNEIYMKLDLTWEKSKTWANNLLNDIQDVEGYSADMPIMIDGLESLNREQREDAVLDELDSLLLTNSYTFCIDSDAYNENLLFHYYRVLLDVNIVSMTEEQKEEIRNTQIYQDMPTYPNTGSVEAIDGCVVVKIN